MLSTRKAWIGSILLRVITVAVEKEGRHDMINFRIFILDIIVCCPLVKGHLNHSPNKKQATKLSDLIKLHEI